MTLKTQDKHLLVSYLAQRPDYFCERILGSKLYDKQREMALAMVAHRRIAVNGANATGKDFMAAQLIWWWEHTRYPAITIVIGPTHRQVGDIIFKELRNAYLQARIPLDGQMYETPRWEYDDRHYVLGFATDQPFNIQGFHSPSLLCVLTEAHNLEQSHIDAVKRLNPSKLLLVGNPLCSSGEFYDAFHSLGDVYKTVQISAFDTPNVIEGREVIPGLVMRQDIEERKREWGEESALYVASVLGRFPDNLEDAVVPRSLILEAVGRKLEGTGPALIACDVARGGNDSTIVYRLQGGKAGLLWQAQGKSTQETAGKLGLLAEADKEIKSIVVDDVGVGGGVTDRLRESPPKGVNIIAFKGGEKARREERYVNAISEAWLELADAFRSGTISIDNNPRLIAQLSSRRKKVQGDRRLALETKEDYKKRVSASPDDADALAMAWWAYGHTGAPRVAFL